MRSSKCRDVEHDWGTSLLSVSVLGPVDLVLTNCRADDQDLADIRHVIRVAQLERVELEAAVRRALVPETFADIFPNGVARMLAQFG